MTRGNEFRATGRADVLRPGLRPQPRKWKDGRYGHGQLMLVDDLLLVQTEPGPVALVEANPTAYREVAKLAALHSKTWNNPALAGDILLLRNDQEMVCYKLSKCVLRAAN